MKARKDYRTYHEVKNSFLATINVSKHMQGKTPKEIMHWYLELLDKQGRSHMLGIAENNQKELGDAYTTWLHKNSPIKQKTTSYDTDVDTAIEFLKERGYQVIKIF